MINLTRSKIKLLNFKGDFHPDWAQRYTIFNNALKFIYGLPIRNEWVFKNYLAQESFQKNCEIMGE